MRIEHSNVDSNQLRVCNLGLKCPYVLWGREEGLNAISQLTEMHPDDADFHFYLIQRANRIGCIDHVYTFANAF